MTDLLRPRWEVDYGSDPLPSWDASMLSARTGPVQVRECRTAPRWNSQLGWTVNGVMAAELVRFFRAQRGPAAKFYFYTPSSLPWDLLAAGTGDGLTAAFPFAGREVYPGSDVVTVGGAAKVLGTDYLLGLENRLLFSEDPRCVVGLTNLLTAADSSFESGVGSWVGSPVSPSQSSAEARFGTKSLKLVSTAQYDVIYITTRPAATAGHNYGDSGYIKGEAGKTARLDLRFYDVGGTDIGGAAGTNTTMTGSWQRLVTSFVSPATTATVMVAVYNTYAGAHTFYLDGVQIVQSNLPGAWALGGTAATVGWVRNGGAEAVMTPGMAAPTGPATATRIVTSGGASTTKFYQVVGTPAIGVRCLTALYIKVDGTKDVTVLDTLGGTQTFVHGTGWISVYLSSVFASGGHQINFVAPAAGDSLDFTLWHPWAAWTDANLGDPSAAWGYIPTQETAITVDSLGRQRIVFVEGSVPVGSAAVVISYRGQRLLLGRCTSDVVPKTVDADVFSIAAAFTGEEV